MPDVCSYSSMVTRDTVYTDFTMAAGQSSRCIECLCTGHDREKIWIVQDPEFGDDAGTSAIILRASNSLKSAGA